MEEKKKDYAGLDLDLLEKASVLMDRLVYIVLIVIIASTATFCYTKYMVTPMYRSTAKLYLQNNQEDTYTTTNDITSATQMMEDCQVLITSRSVLEKVIDNLGMDMSLSPTGLSGMIAISAVSDSRVLQISVANANPVIAKQLVDEICNVSVDVLPDLAKIKSVTITDEGSLPSTPYSPNVNQIVTLVALLSLVLSCAGFVLASMIDDKVKTPEDAERYLGISVLGMIPEADTPNGKGKKKRASHHRSHY